MKQYYIILCFLSIQTVALAQNNTGIADDFKYLAMHNLNVNTSTISTFSNSTVKGSQYLYDKWTAGSVTTNENVTYAVNYLFNFDKVNQNLYVKYTAQNDLTILLDKSTIKSFNIANHAFINFPGNDPKLKNTFLEILVPDTAVRLYKSTSTKFVKFDPTNMMNLRTGNLSSEFVETVTYYTNLGSGELKKLSLSEGNIRKAFKAKSDKVDQYFDMIPNKELDESVLVNLVRYLN